MLRTSTHPRLRRPFARLNPKPRAIKNQEVSRIAKHRRNKKYPLTAAFSYKSRCSAVAVG
jgi:hypothetical protein